MKFYSLIIVIFYFCIFKTYSHSGRTDSLGGHKDSSGRYHFHYHSHDSTEDRWIPPEVDNYRRTGKAVGNDPYILNEHITSTNKTTAVTNEKPTYKWNVAFDVIKRSSSEKTSNSGFMVTFTTDKKISSTEVLHNAIIEAKKKQKFHISLYKMRIISEDENDRIRSKF